MPAKQEPGSTSVTSVREVTSMRFEHPLPVVPDLVDQPVRLVGFEEGVVGDDIGGDRHAT